MGIKARIHNKHFYDFRFPVQGRANKSSPFTSIRVLFGLVGRGIGTLSHIIVSMDINEFL